MKTSTEIKKWFKNSKDIEGDFKTTAMLMEKAGTGGAIFRNFYRDFLKESYEILKIENINKSQKMFAEIADLWTEVSTLFRSEERRVGKGFRSRWSRYHKKKKRKTKILHTLPPPP